jgi:hypothetical protein
MSNPSQDSRIEELFKHSEEMLRLAGSLYDACRRKENKVRSKYRMVLSAYFSRAHELYESILLLVRANRITDAGVLLRSLSNLIINLNYFAEKKEERATLFIQDAVRIELRFLTNNRDFFDPIWTAKEVDAKIKDLNDQKAEIDDMVNRDYPNAQALPRHILDRAIIDKEMKHNYSLVYADLSRFEHSDFSGSMAYVDADTCNPIMRSGVKVHSAILNHRAILFLANTFLGMLFEFFNEEFQLNWKTQVHDLSVRLGALLNCS